MTDISQDKTGESNVDDFWAMHTDPTSGNKYYYNSITEESKWVETDEEDDEEHSSDGPSDDSSDEDREIDFDDEIDFTKSSKPSKAKMEDTKCKRCGLYGHNEQTCQPSLKVDEIFRKKRTQSTNTAYINFCLTNKGS